MADDEYNIDTYTDQECFEVLNLNNPSDRELEMKILQFMDKYENKSKRLYRFFESMYDRFFTEEEDAIEGFESDMKEQPREPDQKTSPQTIGNSTTTISTIATHNVDYIADPKKLNPVERKTIFKMISIDSQFREDPRNTSATNFTMNLSESIDNVISMKLYSVQIPYTWYTINESFGSNFFYIKGNSPGINNGDHDIKVDVNSGTYTADGIVSAINTKLNFFKNVRNNENKNKPEYSSIVDLSMGETKVSYQLGASDAKIVFEFDLNKKYNETDYQLFFSTWSTPDVSGSAKSLTIPSFLGFNYNSYYPYVAYSQKNILSLIGDTESANLSLYTVNSGSNDPQDISNNYFTIYQYSGTTQFNISTSTIINRIPIQLTLPNGTYSRNTIYNNISEQMAANGFLDPTWSYFTRVNNTFSNLTNSHFEIAVKLNRIEIPQTDNSKLAIVFPSETNIGGKHIWTGTDSCFVFKVDKFELNEVVSETETLLTNYIIDTSRATIKIECTKVGYDVIENTRTATVPGSLASGYPNGYLFNSYIDAVNSAFIAMNNATIVPIYKPDGEFNINVASSTYNTGLTIANDNAKFQFDIAREFNQSTYIVDLSSCLLSISFSFDASYHNLTNSNFSVSKPFSSRPLITIDSTNNKLVLIPKKTGGPNGNGFGNQNSPNVDLFFTTGVFTLLSTFIESINNDFIRFVDVDGYPIMRGSGISFDNSTLTLRLGISKLLTEINYNVSFIDASQNSWNHYSASSF